MKAKLVRLCSDTEYLQECDEESSAATQLDVWNHTSSLNCLIYRHDAMSCNTMREDVTGGWQRKSSTVGMGETGESVTSKPFPHAYVMTHSPSFICHWHETWW
ncbi:hypothetical protein ECG_02633 [Echinococcus granulosus]|nr:hypothetical protein ECG_02632 [Echinococcus granulosus]KAH9284493.1 hypothetical protein ECG_02633 [Echinococcus granulosus]